ncbi:hypothetical protein GLAREA_03217 [Glarea lozoyensis ATCC 20868]|uniref:Stc1 domain-containing protein n=1 Tax=Glarea lozoyensis (strain ATCC 20868 / MF5171) TaxID=1116229 RepID=S3CLG0_GLAL2|nr:uncharacterized protein GLAREA_03217 [Glarea lozoyensis ATCC 20868]EPE27302.1 hypothetical protein GLAREA_03217 [Glarea lozoyensis ATCC 20868]
MTGWSTASKTPGVIPTRLECWQCRKVKVSELFSNKQKKEYLATVGMAKSGSAAPKIRCDECTNDQRVEMVCQGPCSFSKTARKNGANHWCIACQSWKLSVEPSVAVGPAPNSKLAPDETHDLPDYDKGDSEDEEQHYGNDDQSTIYETGIPSKAWYKHSQVASTADASTFISDPAVGAAQKGFSSMNLGTENKPPLPHLRGPDYKQTKQKPAEPVNTTPSKEASSGFSKTNAWGGNEPFVWKPVGRRARQSESVNGSQNTFEQQRQKFLGPRIVSRPSSSSSSDEGNIPSQPTVAKWPNAVAKPKNRGSEARAPQVDNGWGGSSANNATSKWESVAAKPKKEVRSPQASVSPSNISTGKWAKCTPAPEAAPVVTRGPSPPPPATTGPAYRYSIDGDSDSEYDY